MTPDIDSVREAVETLSRLVAVPRPPGDLRAETGRPKRSFLGIALAATLILAAAGAWLLLHRPAPPSVPDAARFVVEHLRVRGKAVEPRVMEVRGAGALVLMATPSDTASAEVNWNVRARTPWMRDGVAAPHGRF